jgi:putative phage-type endonuclease
MTEQRTEQWLLDRLGHVTASKADCVLAGKETAKRHGYIIQLVTERLTGQVQDSFSNSAMAWGTEQEPVARAVYQSTLAGDLFVEETGFVKHPTIEWLGASPDGLVGEGLVEIKCPNSTTHVEYLMDGKVPAKYKPQMMVQMLCTQRKWCDFVSFDPRLPEDLQLFVVRFEPKQEELDKIESAIKNFLTEVDKATNKLRSKHGSRV